MTKDHLDHFIYVACEASGLEISGRLVRSPVGVREAFPSPLPCGEVAAVLGARLYRERTGRIVCRLKRSLTLWPPNKRQPSKKSRKPFPLLAQPASVGIMSCGYWRRQFEQALVLKSARLISGLLAGKHLLDAGFLQELGAIQRMMDEIDADIMFLSGPSIFGKLVPAHQEYLDEFFAEEFNKPGDTLGPSPKRHRVSRKRIRAYNATVFPYGSPVDKTVAVTATLEKAYSGFVHAAAGHIMDIYFGDPPRWHIEGMAGTFRQIESREDFINYIYRSIGAQSFVAKALKLDDLCMHLYGVSKTVAAKTGIATWEPQ